MQLQRTLVERITIGGYKNYSPINVLVETGETEDQATIRISCFGDEWSHYWGNMGGSIADFFKRCDNDYLISKLSNIPRKEEDLDSDWKLIKQLIIKTRKENEISKESARQAYNHVTLWKTDRREVMCGLPDVLECIPDLLEPWYIDWPMYDNPQYKYMSGIIDAVRIALNTEKDS